MLGLAVSVADHDEIAHQNNPKGQPRAAALHRKSYGDLLLGLAPIAIVIQWLGNLDWIVRLAFAPTPPGIARKWLSSGVKNVKL